MLVSLHSPSWYGVSDDGNTASYSHVCFLAPNIIKTIIFTARVKTKTPKTISFCKKFILYKEIPPKDKKPKHIKPTVMKVIPNPCNPSGISAYFNLSVIPAKATIANAQPVPAPKP